MKKILTLASLLLIAGGSSAHQLAFDKLTPGHKATRTVVSFDLNEQEIINQYHFRAKYFDIEKWMESQNLVLKMDHLANVEIANHGVHTKQLQEPEIILNDQGGFHGAIDPFNKSNNLTGNSGGEVNSVVNRVNIAGLVAVSMCNAYASVNIKQASYHLTPQFIAPVSLLQGINPSTAELSDYSLSEGVKFNCVSQIDHARPMPKESIKDFKHLKQGAVTKVK
ncbi:hypothetical protein HWQ46_09575 [Shewanella sp. D64]|uniref:hypothetical protein n=1 Tax=unclassified Shewanella TaxID=196818 RepID=UPI0022BA434F|nr:MULTISPECIES: hypothetical protein [unclassified Shewanella]MEC4725792.1 hypothetical protein [Shewanella sp. D64]MEC4737601.1 hypothetical protein [Shewanella sp. E94]WBJ93418.1 hypothetical protein HWQ47_15910 [Shewanella sp. MTB7]